MYINDITKTFMLDAINCMTTLICTNFFFLVLKLNKTYKCLKFTLFIVWIIHFLVTDYFRYIFLFTFELSLFKSIRNRSVFHPMIP